MRKTFAAAPFTTFLIRLHIHQTKTELYRAYWKLGSKEDSSVIAFASRPIIVEDTIADIHLCQEDLSLDTITHEAQHAALHLARYTRLNLENDDGEELFAGATAHIVCQVTQAVRELRASKRQSKSRRRNCGRASS